MKHHLLSVGVLALLFFPSASLYALQEALLFSQTTPGSVTTALSLTVNTCNGWPAPVGTPSIIRTGNQFSVSSQTVVADPAPPSFCGIEVYTTTASLGALPDGTYTVVWTFGLPGQPITVRGQFSLSSGSLQTVVDPAPFLGPWQEMVFALLLAGSAFTVFRSRSNYSLKRTAAGRLR